MNENNKYFEVNGAFFTVKIINGIPTPVRVSQEEVENHIVENIMLADDAIEEDQTCIFAEAIEKARNDLKTSLENHCKEAVLKSLGFSKDRWSGKWDVDHCNGRMSEITNLLSAEIKAQFKQKISVEELGITKRELNELKKAAKKDFLDNFKNQLRRYARDEGASMATRMVQEIVQEEIEKSNIKEMAKEILTKTKGK